MRAKDPAGTTDSKIFTGAAPGTLRSEGEGDSWRPAPAPRGRPAIPSGHLPPDDLVPGPAPGGRLSGLSEVTTAYRAVSNKKSYRKSFIKSMQILL
ncbi:hypothetical protein GCM10009525_53550 [Streptosporangium amethystogenes subsp. fukuiense]